MQGGRGTEERAIPGGKFSLGRLKEGSGYCVGAIVESRMGMSSERDGVAGRTRGRKGTVAGNGMKDVWVIGEGFFRGVGAVFDVSLSLFPSPCSNKNSKIRQTLTNTAAVSRTKGWLPHLLAIHHSTAN